MLPEVLQRQHRNVRCSSRDDNRRPSRRRRVFDSQLWSQIRSPTRFRDRSRSAVAAGRRMPMKTMWEEDPTELLGLEEDEGSNELGGSEFEDEEEPTELMGLGEEEGDEEDDSYEEEEEDPNELYATDEEDEYDEEGE